MNKNIVSEKRKLTTDKINIKYQLLKISKKYYWYCFFENSKNGFKTKEEAKHDLIKNIDKF